MSARPGRHCAYLCATIAGRLRDQRPHPNANSIELLPVFKRKPSASRVPRAPWERPPYPQGRSSAVSGQRELTPPAALPLPFADRRQARAPRNPTPASPRLRLPEPFREPRRLWQRRRRQCPRVRMDRNCQSRLRHWRRGRSDPRMNPAALAIITIKESPVVCSRRAKNARLREFNVKNMASPAYAQHLKDAIVFVDRDEVVACAPIHTKPLAATIARKLPTCLVVPLSQSSAKSFLLKLFQGGARFGHAPDL